MTGPDRQGIDLPAQRNYRPRRAAPQVEEFAALDDHQQLLVAIEALAQDWDAIAERCGPPGRSLVGDVHRNSAAQLRNLARRYS